MNNYYTYIYFEPKTQTPFYIGKGRSNRFYPSAHTKEGVNAYLVNKIKKIGVKNVLTVFAIQNVCEEVAMCCEVDLIHVIGRKDQGKGPLINLTDGGDGWSLSKISRQRMSNAQKANPVRYWLGKKRSDEDKRKMCESQLGKNHWNWGGTHSKETCAKIGKGNRGKLSPYKGIPRTDEVKRKVSEGLKRYWRKKKNG